MWTAEDVKKSKGGRWTADTVKNIRAGNKVNINDPINQLSPLERDRAEQARRSKMGTIKNMAPETITSIPPPKPTLLQKVGSFAKGVITDPLGTLDRIDQSQFGKDIMAGVGQANKSTANVLKSIGGDKVPIVKDALSGIDKISDPLIQKGGTGILSQVTQSLPRAVSSMGLAFLSGGASVPTQLGGNATLQAANQVLTSPTFVNSMLQSYGGAYGQAKEEGANRPQAITKGLLQAFPEALIEQAGGVEQLPANMAKQSLLETIGKSALEEGMEEVFQYPFEALARKATYAPDAPFFSMTENAVINPKDMAQGALVGGLAGGLLGGGAKVVTGDISLPKFKRDVQQTQQQTAQQAPIQAEQQTRPMPIPKKTDFYTDQYGNVSNDSNYQAPLQLPEAPSRITENDIQLSEAADTIKIVDENINRLAQDPTWGGDIYTAADSQNQATLDNLISYRNELEAQLDGQQYTYVEPKYKAIDNMSFPELNKLTTDLKSSNEQKIQGQIDWLRSTMGQGVEPRFFAGDLYNKQGQWQKGFSKNELWYQKWMEENQYRRPNKKELRDIAIDHLQNGVETVEMGFLSPDAEFVDAQGMINYADALKSIQTSNVVPQPERFSPNRITPANLAALNRRGLNPEVQKMSDRLAGLRPPIQQGPILQQQPTVNNEIRERRMAGRQAQQEAAPTFAIETDSGPQIYNTNDFVDNEGRTLEQALNDDPVVKELNENLKDTSSKADSFIEQIAPSVKDRSGFMSNMDTVYRTFERAFGKNYNYVKSNYLDPFDASKGDFSREVKNRANAIYGDVVQKRNIKKGSKESAAIQWYGEGERIQGSDKGFINKLFNPQYEVVKNEAGREMKVPKMEEYTLNDLKREFPNKWQDIVESEKVFRQQYDEIIDLINESRKKVYPYVEQQIEDMKQRGKELDQDISEYKKKLNDKMLTQNEINRINKKVSELAKQRNEITKKLSSDELWRNKRLPKKKNYFRHFKEMNSGVVGLFNIIENPSQISSNLAAISEFTKPKSKWASFMQQRGRGGYTADAVGGFLDYLKPAAHAIHIDPHITKFRQLGKDIATGTVKTKNANNLIKFLNDYSNSLAGKTNKYDRLIQEDIPGGRKTFAVMNWMNSRLKANAVLGNLRSSITQIANIPAGISEVADPVALGKGMGQTMAGIIGKGDNAISKSDFISERYMDSVFDKFDTKITSKPKQFAAWLLGAGDELGTRFTWNSAYQKALAENNPNPIKYADDLTRNVVAGRGIGEVPLMQQSKVFQTFFPFQLEVGNLAHVMAKQVKGKEFGKVMILLVANWLFNELAESIYGDRPLLDPIDAMIDALSDEDATVMTVVGRSAGEVLSNVPMGQTVASLWPEYPTDVNSPLGGYSLPSRKQLFGDSDPTRYGSGFLLGDAIKDPFYKLALPWGGSQLKKTVEGIDALNKGGVIKDDKLRYLVPKTPQNFIKAPLFGKSSTNEAREYFDKDRRPLSPNQTQQVMSSDDPQEVYLRIMQQRQINSLSQKLKEVAADDTLSRAEKDKKITEIRQKINELRN